VSGNRFGIRTVQRIRPTNLAITEWRVACDSLGLDLRSLTIFGNTVFFQTSDLVYNNRITLIYGPASSSSTTTIKLQRLLSIAQSQSRCNGSAFLDLIYAEIHSPISRLSETLSSLTLTLLDASPSAASPRTSKRSPGCYLPLNVAITSTPRISWRFLIRELWRSSELTGTS
jgi:hypothetical protein